MSVVGSISKRCVGTGSGIAGTTVSALAASLLRPPLGPIAQQRAAGEQREDERSGDEGPQRGLSSHVQSMTPHVSFRTVGILLQKRGLIRELVAIARARTGNCRSNNPPTASTPATAPSWKRPSRKWLFHEPARRFPLGRGNPGSGATVRDDLHVAVRHQYIDEYAVAKFGVPDAKLREYLRRALARRDAGPQAPKGPAPFR